MTKSELIKKLNEIEGDLPVKLYNDEQGSLYNIDEIMLDKDYTCVPLVHIIIL